jgi:ATP phosphoribosyltransferase regulatory subunit
VDEDARRALRKALQLGGGDTALSQARKLAGSAGMEDAVDHLVRVRDLVADYGYGNAVQLDFGLYPGLSYYTGIIVEAYAPGAGLPVASGGRYDELFSGLEWNVPAVGFAISLDRLSVVLEDAHVDLGGHPRRLASPPAHERAAVRPRLV